MSAESPRAVLVCDFVNTWDLEAGSDEIASADALGAWLRGRDLLADEPVDEADLDRARRLREAVRAALRLNVGERPATPPAAIGADCTLRLGFGEDGRPRLEPVAAGAAGALDRIAAAVATVAAGGDWERLKACAAEDCQWAFVDHSKSHSRRW